MIMKMSLTLKEQLDWTLTLMRDALLTEQIAKISSSKQIACKKELIRYG